MVTEVSVESAQPGSGIPRDLREDPARAWAPYEPGADRPGTSASPPHLLRRAAFGGSWDQIEKAVSEGIARTVERLLHPDADVAAFEALQAELEAAAARSDSTEGLRTWWLRRQACRRRTPSEHDPLLARTLRHSPPTGSRARTLCMTTCGPCGATPWATSGSSSASHPPAPRSLPASRPAPAGGRGRTTSSPADSSRYSPSVLATSRKRTSARRHVRSPGGSSCGTRSVTFPREHDGGPKKILGREGNFARRGLVKIVLEQPATSRLVVRKLWRGSSPRASELSDVLVEPLAKSFAEDFDIPPPRRDPAALEPVLLRRGVPA